MCYVTDVHQQSACSGVVQGLHGWDILRACDAVKKAAREKGFEAGIKAATAIHKRASRVSFRQILLRLYELQLSVVFAL